MADSSRENEVDALVAFVIENADRPLQPDDFTKLNEKILRAFVACHRVDLKVPEIRLAPPHKPFGVMSVPYVLITRISKDGTEHPSYKSLRPVLTWRQTMMGLSEILRSRGVADSIPQTATIDGQKQNTRKRRRDSGNRTQRPLTPKQIEVVQLFGELKGNFKAIGERMGISRQGAQKHYEAATKKLGTSALPKPKTKALPKDKRGQAAVPDPSK